MIDINALTVNELIVIGMIASAIASFAVTQTIKARYRDHHEKEAMYDSDVRTMGHGLGLVFTFISLSVLVPSLSLNSLGGYSVVIGAATPFMWKAGMGIIRKFNPAVADSLSNTKK